MDIMHVTCCDDGWALCSQFVGFDEEAEYGHLREGEEWCLGCLRLDNDETPCPNPLCPLRSRTERIRWCLSANLWGQAVRQLWKPKIR